MGRGRDGKTQIKLTVSQSLTFLGREFTTICFHMISSINSKLKVWKSDWRFSYVYCWQHNLVIGAEKPSEGKKLIRTAGERTRANTYRRTNRETAKTDGLCVRMKNITISLQLCFYFVSFLLCGRGESHCFYLNLLFRHTDVMESSFILLHCCRECGMLKRVLIFSFAWLHCEEENAGSGRVLHILCPHTPFTAGVPTNCNWTWESVMGSADARCILKSVLSHWALS